MINCQPWKNEGIYLKLYCSKANHLSMVKVITETFIIPRQTNLQRLNSWNFCFRFWMFIFVVTKIIRINLFFSLFNIKNKIKCKIKKHFDFKLFYFICFEYFSSKKFNWIFFSNFINSSTVVANISTCPLDLKAPTFLFSP